MEYSGWVVAGGVLGAASTLPVVGASLFRHHAENAVTEAALGALAGIAVSAVGCWAYDKASKLKLGEPLALGVPIIIIVLTVVGVPAAALSAAGIYGFQHR